MNRALLFLVSSFLSLPVFAGPAPPAFPEAEGFGAMATGGRGGQVIKVTTLSPTGAGSLKAALDTAGPRIIVFEVDGVIDATSLPNATITFDHGDVTIAGQTAAALGRGITLRGHLYADGDFSNIVVRHMRFRPPAGADGGQGDGNQHDGLRMTSNSRILLDHVDISHGADENLDLWGGANDVTIQWSVISHPRYDAGHPDGAEHNYGVINGPGGGRISLLHTLFAHNSNRTPAFSAGPAEVIGNVSYNYKTAFTHNNPVTVNAVDGPTALFNVIGNSFIEGSGQHNSPVWIDPENCQDPFPASYHFADNHVDSPSDASGAFGNPWTTDSLFGPDRDPYFWHFCDDLDASNFTDSAHDFSAFAGRVAPTVLPRAEAHDAVLERAGAWPRDLVARTAAEDVANRTGAWGGEDQNGLDDPAQWLAGLTSSAPPADMDGDGMPDEWEDRNGFDKTTPDDDTPTPSGYTAIELYLNELAFNLVNGTIFEDGFESGDTSTWQ